MIASPKLLPSTPVHILNTSLLRRYAPRMKRSNLNEGRRDEILAELKQSRADRAAHGNHIKVAEFDTAIGEIEDGADEVRVRHAIYRVVEDEHAVAE